MSQITLTDHSAGLVETPGIQVASHACDIRGKNDNRLDLALIVSSTAAAAAGVFTLNDVRAAPVQVCKDILAAGSTFRGIVVNSGNANACTGQQGLQDARSMCAQAEQATGSPAHSFFVCSTGRIGAPLPIGRIHAGIDAAAATLSQSPEAGRKAAQAILTSDTSTKTVAARFEVDGRTVTLSAMAKGAGMIEPNMATMLAFIATDADIDAALLRQLLKTAVDQSFNRITVDGDMSTNDTVLILANGVSGVKIQNNDSSTLELFQQALNQVCRNLASKIVGDGEKITKVVQLEIQAARTIADAEKIARAIGNSLLVKTSWYGNDPNWGRLMDAAGYARTGLVESKVDLFYNDVPILLQGTPQLNNKDQWKAIVSQRTFTIRLCLNLGDAHYDLLTTDLSEAYVNFNKSE